MSVFLHIMGFSIFYTALLKWKLHWIAQMLVWLIRNSVLVNKPWCTMNGSINMCQVFLFDTTEHNSAFRDIFYSICTTSTSLHIHHSSWKGRKTFYVNRDCIIYCIMYFLHQAAVWYICFVHCQEWRDSAAFYGQYVLKSTSITLG